MINFIFLSSGEMEGNRRSWLPKDFKLSNERINSIINSPRMVFASKEDLINELINENIIENHKREVERTETDKFFKEMKKRKKEKEEKNEKT